MATNPGDQPTTAVPQSRWVLEPAKPGEINLQVDVGEGAKVPAALRELLEKVSNPSESTEGQRMMADAKCLEVHVSACAYYVTCKVQL